jgi:hypothetical protein
MDGNGEHYLKWSWPGSEGQKSHFLSYVEYKSYTNVAMLWKTGHANGGHTWQERVKEGI